MDKLKGTKYFTKLDVCWGYNNVWIRKGDKWKAAFKTNKGLFKPTVMFFRMCNSLAAFQAMMDNIFMTMIDNQLVIVYMNNILTFSDMKEGLEKIIRLVMEKL
jgi:Reverse transcriptase (RNA-dependent DNA polymerase)